MKTNVRQRIQIPEDLLSALKEAYKKKLEHQREFSIQFSKSAKPRTDSQEFYAGTVEDNSNKKAPEIKYSLADIDNEEDIEEEISDQIVEPVKICAKKTVSPKKEKVITNEEILYEVCDNLHTVLNRNIDYSSLVKDLKLSSTFKETLFKLIDDRGLRDSDVYKKAKVDRRLFSKIRSNKSVARNTVIRLALALELNLEETDKLLNSAHFALADNDYFDVVIKWCIDNKVYDVGIVDNLLFSLRLDSIFSKY